MEFKKILLTIGGLSLLIIPTCTFAVAQQNGERNLTQAGTSTATETATETQNATSNQGANSAIRNCERIEARVQTKLENYSTSKTKFTTAYDNMLTRLDNFISQATEDGIDVSKLEADVAVFEAMIDEFKTTVDSSYSLLERTQEYACGEAEGQFAQSLTQSRNKVQVAHQKASEIRSYYKETIRLDLLDIKSQLEETATTDASSDTETEE